MSTTNIDALILAVARELLSNTIGDPTRGEPFIREERSTEDVIRDAQTAVRVVLAYLEKP